MTSNNEKVASDTNIIMFSDKCLRSLAVHSSEVDSQSISTFLECTQQCFNIVTARKQAFKVEDFDGILKQFQVIIINAVKKV